MNSSHTYHRASAWRSRNSKRPSRFSQQTIHVLGRETDLTLSIAGRSFINSDGLRNFPDGEFFTSPVEDSAQGVIRFSFPAAFGGRSVEDVRLRFEHGVVVEARAAQDQQGGAQSHASRPQRDPLLRTFRRAFSLQPFRPRRPNGTISPS